MQDDARLLRRFASEHSEEAFTELVRKYVDLVYSSALRRVAGNSALAEDVSQTVFTDLARKASTLPCGIVLAAWLHRATQLACAAAVRAEIRRVTREQQAAAMQALEHSDQSSSWDCLRPVLDDALDSLNDRDREAVLLRFFQQHSLRELGSALGVSEDAARMRVDRALNKLRDLLAERGVTTTTAALSAALLAQAAQAAPFGLATALAGAALTGQSPSLSTSTIGLIHIMNSTKLASGIAGLIAIAATTTAVLQHRELTAVRSENDSLRQEIAQGPAAATPDNVPDPAEQARRQKEREELMRLRGEVTLLRQQQRKLTPNAQNNAGAQQLSNTQNPEIERSEEEDWMKELGLARMHFAKHWMLALVLFAKEHDDKLPETFDKANPNFEKIMAQLDDAERRAVQSLRTDQFEIVYSGSLSEIAEPGRTIIIREKEPVQRADGRRYKAYGFADGHSEFHAEGARSFEEWERERMPKNQSSDSTAP